MSRVAIISHESGSANEWDYLDTTGSIVSAPTYEMDGSYCIKLIYGSARDIRKTISSLSEGYVAFLFRVGAHDTVSYVRLPEFTYNGTSILSVRVNYITFCLHAYVDSIS